MNLLTIAEDGDLGERFEGYFDEVCECSIEDVKIDVDKEEVISYVNGREVRNYDALFLRPITRAATFTRLFLETLTEEDVETNIDGTSYYIIAKKPYLFKVLSEKGITIPDTYVVSSQKTLKSLKGSLEGKIVCKQFEELVRKDIMKTEDPEDIDAFSESLEHGKNYMIVQEFVEGEAYDCLYVNGDVISTKITGDTWRKSPSRDSCSEKYHKPPSEVQKLVEGTAKAIGSRFCSVRLVDRKVVDVKMSPDIERFKKLSGKDTFEKVAEMLKSDASGGGE